MRSSVAIAIVAVLGGRARADEPVVTKPITTQPTAPTELTEEEQLQAIIDAGETVEIFDERPDKPFDRDTEIRLTGEQLAARGAVDLGTALALLPDISVRDAGRGGFNLDIRGGRRSAVIVMIDGVSVSDPYYGTFDVSTIPITDIVQIRVATTPQSPIDGPGGTSGVVEVITRDAVGPQVVIARLTSSTLQAFGMTGTARVALAEHLALRVSASGLVGMRDYELPMNVSVDEGRRSATGSMRLEYRRGDRRAVLDASLDDRSYLTPPLESGTNFQLIDKETTVRATAKVDDKIGALQLQGQAWAFSLQRDSRNFDSADLGRELTAEILRSSRFGGLMLATKPFKRDFRWVTSATFDYQDAKVTEAGRVSQGEVMLLQGAAALQYERSRFRLDAAGGVAVPFGVDADPWPEAKVVAKYKPLWQLELTGTVGYKGRVPTLRERFDARDGNPDLGPEKAVHAELRAIETRDRLRLEVAPFYRRTRGTTRLIDGMLQNLGELDFYGVDFQGRYTVHPKVEVGGSYNYIRAKSDTRGNSLDRLPNHRADAWVQVFALRQLAALARVRYVGEQTESSTVLPDYLLLEGTLTAPLSKSYLAVLRIEDALDERPITRADFVPIGRVVSLILQGTWE